MKGVFMKLCLLFSIVVISIGGAAEVEAANLWIPVTKDAPSIDHAYDARFSDAGKATLELLREARLDIGAPAISAAVGLRGELVWAGAVGFADIAAETPATPSTKFRIGSTSKALTATALALLVDDGLIDMNTAIGKYVPNLPNEKWNGFTSQQLASHTAGLPGYDENTDREGRMQTMRLDKQYDTVFSALEIFDGSDLLFEPGTNFHYSSFDVNLLSVVMESAAKQPYLDIVKKRVTDPLGMRDTHADYQDRPVLNRAMFYYQVKGKVRPIRKANLSQKWASGGFVSTSSDLVRLGLSYFDAKFIDPKTTEHFWTPQRLANGDINVQNYAIGWRSSPTDRIFGDEKPIHAVHHGGVSSGAMSWLVIYPKLELIVALNINTNAKTFQDFNRHETKISQLFLEYMSESNIKP
jgi:serine beta-lactamase-like protein LACTB